MLAFKDYQQRVLDIFDTYLAELANAKIKADKVDRANEQEDDEELKRPRLDYPLTTWNKLQKQNLIPIRKDGSKVVPFSPRTDELGNFIPSVCYKIPTGGGKTLLATASISALLGKLLLKNTGFILWIVPNEAIYTQTKKAFSDREHPYRQLLDKTSAGKFKLLEKNDRLDIRDVTENLCVMLLMLQATNRETKETLRLFRDRGNVSGFVPEESDLDGHMALKKALPNLDCYDESLYTANIPLVKSSLGNALKIIRPIIVMDEQQKAYTKLAFKTLYSFNPQFVLELSATPKDLRVDGGETLYANVLANVVGAELDREGMIKLPLNVKVKAGNDWRDCLREASEKLTSLQNSAERYQSDGGQYIRPILLVQVERVGADQRDGLKIHAEDAKDYLLTLGYSEDEIAIKTSEKNELKAVENQDLLSPQCRVRAIITKAALQEGWDCPFAYVLCSLAVSHNISAMTQLTGRILRQPYAEKTGVSALDECYIYCNHDTTRDVIESIKDGLEADGMADLAIQVREIDDSGGKTTSQTDKRKLDRRTKFLKAEIFLPKVLWCEGGKVRDLDYDRDILLEVDWESVDIKAIAKRIPINATAPNSQIIKFHAVEANGKGEISHDPVVAVEERLSFDAVYVVRAINDLVPNSWVAYSLVEKLRAQLLVDGFDEEKLGKLSSVIIEEFRKGLETQRDAMAESKFIKDVDSGLVQFRLRTDGNNWKMPKTMETDLPVTSKQMARNNGNVIENSIFSPTYEAEYNGDERDFACYLDEVQALKWWHRNVAKAGQYSVQGWRKNKVYPDFLFALTKIDGEESLLVWETKGDQLSGNLDTEYKRKLLSKVSSIFKNEIINSAGQLEIDTGEGSVVQCKLVLMSDWKSELGAIN